MTEGKTTFLEVMFHHICVYLSVPFFTSIVGANRAESLLNTAYFYNGKLFGLRTGEHRLMRLSDIAVDGNK